MTIARTSGYWSYLHGADLAWILPKYSWGEGVTGRLFSKFSYTAHILKLLPKFVCGCTAPAPRLWVHSPSTPFEGAQPQHPVCGCTAPAPRLWVHSPSTPVVGAQPQHPVCWCTAPAPRLWVHSPSTHSWIHA